MAELASSMFREYDIRGRVSDDELNERSVDLIARAYGTMLRRRGMTTAVVGHDYRQNSEWITETAIRGLVSTGVDVVSLGMVLTPVLYSAQYHYQARGGVMVTASHNPVGWSGFKLALGYSKTLGPEEVREELYGLAVDEQFATGSGAVRRADFLDDYIADVLKRVKVARSVRVVVNAGPIVPRVLREAGCEVTELYCNLDWSFPRYYPNPALVGMMDDTGEEVRRSGADVGFAMDGDGDRLGVADEQGEVIWPDRYLILLSRQVLERHPGAKIIFDVKCSQALPEDIEAHGGVPIMWKTGHSYIKQKLWDEKAPLGGEMSGHIFFGEPAYRGFDDAVFAALKLAEFISQREEPLSSLIAQTPYYVSTPALQASCPDEVKYDVVERLTKEFQEEGYDVITVNGARVNFGDGWGLVRASSNLPVLVMRFEAKTQGRVDEFMAIFREKLAQYPEVGSEWESG
jgi:phosphomannomutase/phosphoglucomutase